jgi:hypothetical protein
MNENLVENDHPIAPNGQLKIQGADVIENERHYP